MYLSHPVRRMRDDPVADEDARLVVELAAESSRSGLDSRVRDLGGSVERDLGFDAYLVVAPESAVERLCRIDGIVRIETASTISYGFERDL
jgi:hypothetical protein